MSAKCPTKNKRAFSSANQALRSTAGRGWQASAYRCPCGMWHVTHKRSQPVTTGQERSSK